MFDARVAINCGNLIRVALCFLAAGCTQRCIDPDSDNHAATAPENTDVTTASSTAPSTEPAEPSRPPPRTPIAQIAARGDLTCARARDGDVYCWGDDAYVSATMSEASLPLPTRTRPTRVAKVTDAVDLAVGSSVGCAIVKSGALMCFTDRTGLFGGPAPKLAAVDMHVADATSVSINLAPIGSVCVLKKDATVSCLHATDRGSLPREEKPIEGLTKVTAYAEGDAVHCATRDDKLTCWGWPTSGFMDLKQALESPPLVDGVRQLSAGSAFACVVGTGSLVTCFGDRAPSHPGTKAKLVRAGVYHMCAVDMGGLVVCSGDNRFGQLGSRLRNLTDTVDLAVGTWHTCALDGSGRVRCWGRNTRGQLGDGTVSSERRTAAEVEFP